MIRAHCAVVGKDPERTKALSTSWEVRSVQSTKGESDTAFKQDAIVLGKKKKPLKKPLIKNNDKSLWLERHRK